MRRKGLTACGLSVLLAFGLMACGTSQSVGEQATKSAETDAAKEDAAVGTEAENAAGELLADLYFTVSYDGIKTAKIEAGVSVHDSSVVKADEKYYMACMGAGCDI